MSMSGTPTEFLKLGILEPTDTLNTLVDLNGQWRKVDTGVKDVNTKADTNASNITSLNTQVHDNTENITNILDTNVNQQDDIDLLKTKVQTLETHDGDYETRITNNTNGVQENSELINDLEEDVSGIHLSIGTVPEGETVEGQIGGIDTRVTALENSGTVKALETRVSRVEDSLGTVPSGSTVQGQIDNIVSDVGSVPSGSTVQGQIDNIVSDVGSVPSGSTVQGQIDNIDSQLTGTLSGNDVPFRFSIDGEGNYGYLKADDSFVPFSSGGVGQFVPLPEGYSFLTYSYQNKATSHNSTFLIKDHSSNHYWWDVLTGDIEATSVNSDFVSCPKINNNTLYYKNQIITLNEEYGSVIFFNKNDELIKVTLSSSRNSAIVDYNGVTTTHSFGSTLPNGGEFYYSFKASGGDFIVCFHEQNSVRRYSLIIRANGTIDHTNTLYGEMSAGPTTTNNSFSTILYKSNSIITNSADNWRYNCIGWFDDMTKTYCMNEQGVYILG